MLVRIPTSSAKLGMFVERIECSWWEHPFWRSRQLLVSEQQLELLVLSGADHIVIDDEKGLTLHGQLPQDTDTIDERSKANRPEPHPSSDHHSTRSSSPRPASISPKIRQLELKRARSVLNRSKVVVQQLFDDARMGRAINTQKISSIVNQITALIDVDPSVILNMARLKTKDDYTYLHSVSVCALMINLARTMRLDEPLVREAGMAGLLHDVGKLAIPNEILLKPAKLDDAEFEIVKDHPLVGYRILAASDGISAAAMDVCLHHHEKMDGSGYPDGLNGEELTLLTRMASICDVYDAVTSQRAYNVPWTPSQALARMQSWKGHFDQLILHSFVESLNILPIGTLVRLTGDHLAAVIGETARDYSLPRVRIFYSIGGSKTVPFYDFDISRSPSCWKIMSVEDPLDWGFDDWHRLCADILAKAPSSFFPCSPSADLESDRPSPFRQLHKV